MFIKHLEIKLQIQVFVFFFFFFFFFFFWNLELQNTLHCKQKTKQNSKAVANQTFLKCKDYSTTRMTWIKPNFLWMMYRSGWAEKKGQENILAIYLKVIANLRSRFSIFFFANLRDSTVQITTRTHTNKHIIKLSTFDELIANAVYSTYHPDLPYSETEHKTKIR